MSDSSEYMVTMMTNTSDVTVMTNVSYVTVMTNVSDVTLMSNASSEEDHSPNSQFTELSPSRYQITVDNPSQMINPWSHQPELVPSMILHLIVFMVGVTGHTILLIYLHTTHTKRHNINTGMFLASLSVAELLMLVVYIPLEVTKDLLTQEVRGGSVCKVKEYIKMLTALASVINLAAVSFERYLVVVHPFRIIGTLTRSKCRIALGLIWVLAALLSTPVILSTDVYSIVYTDRDHSQFVEVYKCTEDGAVNEPWVGRAVSLYQLATLLVIPAILSICCYQAVIRVLWRSTRNIHSLTNCTPTSSHNLTGVYSMRCQRFTQHGDRRELSISISTPSHSNSGDENSEKNTRSGHESKSKSVTIQSERGSAVACGEQERNVCSCGQYRYHSSQACTAATAINRGRRRIIQMLVLMLVVYFICWGSWLSSKLIIWWAGDTDLPFTQHFYRFSILAKHLPTVHATINPAIYWVMSSNFRTLVMSWRRKLLN